ncbi:uncharacterized protein LOC127738450 isoform X1 [Mytilus californianus]|uniref:uncharacterized protein LOC127738450 isoform X1 n=1 Tax=Mytilus californianus TaxID=6549 RepID=UPI002246C160|nr:uncharacterized protein LOC127738450 isoform X1 [Mytilus californianus]XP_052105666.1 uncharacterized protein LOC127738450 isoform X1 [Mytilus californianus]XP_052105667.1 uncharacterized protein LOC127738450 isoform X1 [Mytilus californianus]
MEMYEYHNPDRLNSSVGLYSNEPVFKYPYYERSSRLRRSAEDFFENKNNIAMYIVAPILFLVFCSCCGLYGCYKCRRYMKENDPVSSVKQKIRNVRDLITGKNKLRRQQFLDQLNKRSRPSSAKSIQYYGRNSNKDDLDEIRSVMSTPGISYFPENKSFASSSSNSQSAVFIHDFHNSPLSTLTESTIISCAVSVEDHPFGILTSESIEMQSQTPLPEKSSYSRFLDRGTAIVEQNGDLLFSVQTPGKAALVRSTVYEPNSVYRQKSNVSFTAPCVGKAAFVKTRSYASNKEIQAPLPYTTKHYEESSNQRQMESKLTNIELSVFKGSTEDSSYFPSILISPVKPSVQKNIENVSHSSENMLDSDDCSCESSEMSSRYLDLNEKPQSLSINLPKLSNSEELVFKSNGEKINSDDPPSYSSIEQLSYKMRGSSAHYRQEKYRTNNTDSKLDKISSPFSKNASNQWNNFANRGELSYADTMKSLKYATGKQKSEIELKDKTFSDNVNDTAKQAVINDSFQEFEVNQKTKYQLLAEKFIKEAATKQKTKRQKDSRIVDYWR